MVVIGGDVRFAASQILDSEPGDGVRTVARDAFLTFCDSVERMDEEQLLDRFRLPAAEAETLIPALLVYRTLLSETTARRVVVSDASLRTGVLLDLAAPGGGLSTEDFERQVLASAEAVGYRYRFDRAHGRHVAMLAMRLFDECLEDRGISGRGPPQSPAAL
jgi:exopolyphosphatase/guanosine-5'-triphosphate,3'-diphosphate pyrophosphatase